jgi:hypothetical protein
MHYLFINIQLPIKIVLCYFLIKRSGMEKFTFNINYPTGPGLHIYSYLENIWDMVGWPFVYHGPPQTILDSL